MDVEVISADTVKPSKPTPLHLRFVNFSLFYQHGVPILMPLIFFYSKSITKEPIPTKDPPLIYLKKSLSDALSVFFPLAGRIDLAASKVLCNDAGVPYIEARAKSRRLAEIVGKAEMADLDKLLPGGNQGLTDLILAVQVTMFACGGVAIGVQMNSKVTDAFSLLTFVKAWASVTLSTDKNVGNYPRPNFDVETLFPPLKPNGNPLKKPSVDLFKERPVSKRFVFDGIKLAAIRSKYSCSNRISLVVILSAIIWSSIRKIRPDIPHEVFHLVNVRPRMITTPSSTNMDYFGKMAVRAIAKLTCVDVDKDVLRAHFLEKMSESMSKMDGSFLKVVQGVKGAEEFVRVQVGHSERALRGEIMSLGFSSLRSLPVYEADFGWGEPVWVTSATLPMSNFVIFMPSRIGNDIEVYITLSEEAIAKLEHDVEFSSFVNHACARPASKL